VLKKLSVEQLMDIEVTSVSRRPEKLSETASAIQVITSEDISVRRIESARGAAPRAKSGRRAGQFPRLGHQRARLQQHGGQQASGDD